MDIQQFTLFAIGVSLGFFVHTIAGFAAALVAYPIILQVIDIQEAVGFLSIFFFCFGATQTVVNWHNIDKKVFIRISLSAMVGLPIGVGLLAFGNPTILKKALGVFILLYVVFQFFKKKKFEILKHFGIPIGMISGIFSGLFAIGGPPVVAYIYNSIDDPKKIRATIIGIFGVIGTVRIVLFGATGMISKDIIMTSLYIFPFFLLSVFLGQMALKKINDHVFTRILLILLFVSGMSLILRQG